MLAPILLSLLVTLQSGAIGAQDKPWPPAGVVVPGNGVIAPRLVKDEKPKYTADAMRAQIAGSVWLEVVVLTDGKVGDVRVTQSLDRQFGLDDQAIAAVKQWEFKPGTKDGIAVPVVVKIEMTFTVKK